jgi:hypothetical protein
MVIFLGLRSFTDEPFSIGVLQPLLGREASSLFLSHQPAAIYTSHVQPAYYAAQGPIINRDEKYDPPAPVETASTNAATDLQIRHMLDHSKGNDGVKRSPERNRGANGNC